MEKGVLNSISPGEKLRLRDDALPHGKIREWMFKGVEKDGIVLLAHEIDEYIWEAKIDNIDWEKYRKELGQPPS